MCIAIKRNYVWFLLGFIFISCQPDKKNSGEPPAFITGPGTHEVYVGTELTVPVTASDPDSPDLTFSFSAPTIPDWQTRPNPPTITKSGPQAAYFRFTPTASDVGDHFIELAVSDGHHTVTGVLTVRVQASTGSNPYPVFVAPLGSGSTLDLEQASCFSIQIQVEDADSAAVDVTLEEPVAEGYDLQMAPGAFTGTFSWCPSAKQLDAADRFTLNLKADDREGHVTFKRYTLLVRRPEETQCPGAAPSIAHAASASLSTITDIPVEFSITDDAGVFSAPLVYYAVNLADPGNYYIGDLIPVTASLVSGTPTSGQYRAILPNPVLNLNPGESRTLYYVIEAVDDDDTSGKCDHRTLVPSPGMFSTTVTRPSTTVTGGGLCEPCTADIQCGGPNDACIVLAGGQQRCLVDCQENPDGCPTGTSCSVGPLIGVSGTTRRQCVPLAGRCAASVSCTPDAHEEDDALSSSLPALFEGTLDNLTMCMDPLSGQADPDWFRFELAESALVLLEIQFMHAQGDLDMRLRDNQNQVLDRSMSVTNDETIVACLLPGTYYLEVFTWDEDVSVPYRLVYETAPDSCCQADEWEPDNDAAHAVPVQSGDILDNLSICSGDTDWFAIELRAGEYLSVELLFDQHSDSEDIDVYVIGSDGATVLTPCCNPENGQSSTPNESLLFQAPSNGTYYVRVEGFLGAENSNYMISFETTL